MYEDLTYKSGETPHVGDIVTHQSDPRREYHVVDLEAWKSTPDSSGGFWREGGHVPSTSMLLVVTYIGIRCVRGVAEASTFTLLLPKILVPNPEGFGYYGEPLE